MGIAQRPQRVATMDGFLKGAATDCLLTFLWVFTRPALSCLPKLLLPSSPILLQLPINALLTTAFELLSLLLGGGSYNPPSAAASHLAGLSRLPPLPNLALRIPLQAAASAVALLCLLRLVPKRLRRLVSRPAPTDTPLAEAAPTFLSTLAFLIAKSWWRRRVLLRNSLLAILNALLFFLPLPGAFMNPLLAFAWALDGSRLPGRDHFYVYWAGPFAGALAAGLACRLLFAGPPPERKRASSTAAARVRSWSSHLRRPLAEVGSAAFRGLRQKPVALPKGGKALPRPAAPVALRAIAAASPLRGEARLIRRMLATVDDEIGNLRHR